VTDVETALAFLLFLALFALQKKFIGAIGFWFGFGFGLNSTLQAFNTLAGFMCNYQTHPRPFPKALGKGD
jgi:hypothetical protein